MERVTKFLNLNTRCKNRKILCDPFLLNKFGLIERSAEVPAPKPIRKPKIPKVEIPRKKGKAIKKVLRKGKEKDWDAPKTSRGPREYLWVQELELPTKDGGDIHSSGGSGNEQEEIGKVAENHFIFFIHICIFLF